MVQTKRKPAIDHWQDEMELLTEVKTCPAGTILLAVRLGNWDSERITDCLDRLVEQGRIFKKDGLWHNRCEQLELPLEQKTKPPLEQKLNGKRKNCGSGYVRMREVNKKRNEAKGKQPDICFYWHYSYTFMHKEHKKTVYLKHSQVQAVKRLIEKKTPYQDILKYLGKK